METETVVALVLSLYVVFVLLASIVICAWLRVSRTPKVSGEEKPAGHQIPAQEPPSLDQTPVSPTGEQHTKTFCDEGSRRMKQGGAFGIGSSSESIYSLTKSSVSLDSVDIDDNKTEDSGVGDDLTGVENEDFFFFETLNEQQPAGSEQVSEAASNKEPANVNIDSAPKRSLSSVLQTSVMARMLLKQPTEQKNPKRLYRKNSKVCVQAITHKAAQKWNALQRAYDELFKEDIAPLRIM
jgi:hypothetical protein